MDSARISTLLEPYLLEPLTPAQFERISTYIDILLRWNSRTNLTSIRNPDEIVTRHFGESLFAAQTLFPTANRVGTATPVNPAEPSSAENARTSAPPDSPHPLQTLVIPTEGRNPLSASSAHPSSANLARITKGSPSTPQAPGAEATSAEAQRGALPTLDLLDIGSGAGFPGIPIHLWAPNLRATLIESQQKKVAFLREVVRALTLTGIDVSPDRAEDFPSTAHTVTLRAVERFDQILPIAARLVAPQGRLALLISESQIQKAQIILPRFTWHPPFPIPHSVSRVLMIGIR